MKINVCLFSLLLCYTSLSQKAGIKYGIIGSNQYISTDSNSYFNRSVTHGYVGIEYEFTHSKSFLHILRSRRGMNDFYWILELSVSKKGSSNIHPLSFPENLGKTYLTFSPRLKLFDHPRRNQYCRVYGCCDSDDYGKIKPYFTIYGGPKIDFLMSKNNGSEGYTKIISGAILSFNTQIICFNSGSVYTDLQFAYDFNNAFYSNGISARNYSIMFALGFKIRNSDNY